MSKEIIITTTHEIPGIEICLKDVIFEAIEGTNVEELIAKMKEKVKEKNLDGILGFRIVSVVEDGKIKLIGYGSGFEIIKSQWAVY
jgi:selenium-binding protein